MEILTSVGCIPASRKESPFWPLLGPPSNRFSPNWKECHKKGSNINQPESTYFGPWCFARATGISCYWRRSPQRVWPRHHPTPSCPVRRKNRGPPTTTSPRFPLTAMSPPFKRSGSKRQRHWRLIAHRRRVACGRTLASPPCPKQW
jgi:hypothetical protein